MELTDKYGRLDSEKVRANLSEINNMTDWFQRLEHLVMLSEDIAQIARENGYDDGYGAASGWEN